MSCFWSRFERHSALMRQAARSDAALLARLVDAPPRTFHVYAIALDHWQMGKLPLPAEGVAQRFMSRHLRDLLVSAWGDVPEGALSVLNRCGQVAHPPEFYFHVEACLSDRRMGTLLRRGTDPVTAKLLKSVEERARLDPLLDEVRHPFSEEIFSGLDWLVRRLRELKGCGFNERWMRGVLKAMDKRTAKNQLRQILHAFPPTPAPWPGNDVLRPVETAAGLEELSAKMRNCLNELHFACSLVQGTAAFYVLNDELAVHISKRVDGQWEFEQINGPDNRTVAFDLQEAVRLTLAREGVLSRWESGGDLARMMRYL